MARQTVLYVHGFASSGHSTKAQYFRERFKSLPEVDFEAIDLNPSPKDFEYMTTTGLIDRLRQHALDHHLGSVHIIGSSFGGLVALHYAHRYGGVDKMLLLAPGLFWLSGGLSDEELVQWEEAGTAPVLHYAFQRELPVRYALHSDGLRYLEPVPPPVPMIIIHGRNDTTVPINHSRTYSANYPDQVDLIEVNADHDLNGHLEFIWEHARSFLL